MNPRLALDVVATAERVRSTLGDAAYAEALAEGADLDDRSVAVLAREAAHGP